MNPSPSQCPTTGEPERQLPLAVSMGDPKGIGRDIALMSWRERQRHALPNFVIYGDPDVLAVRARALGLAVPIKTLASPTEAAGIFAQALPVWPVQSSAPGDEDRTIVAAIEAAV